MFKVQIDFVHDHFVFGSGWEEVNRCCCFKFGSFLIFTYLGDMVVDLRVYDVVATRVLIPPVGLSRQSG